MKISIIKNLLLLAILLLPDVMWAQTVDAGSAVYVGGHIRRERPNTIATLRESGFSTVILFNVDVQADGTLKTDGETICENGVYVFGQTQPHYVDDVTLLKTQPTGISRIEICIGGWGNGSYGNIKTLINANGTGSETMLYKNFKALLDAVPGIDAVNNDQEQDYDVSTAVKFHTMMYDLGLKTSIAPYTYKSYWTNLVNQLNAARPGACDRVMIQCYDGGASNNPSDWHFGDIPLYAGRTNYQTDMATSIAQMETWRDENGVVGGFVWVYNDETWNLNQWAVSINQLFGPEIEVDEEAVTMFSRVYFKGDSVALGEGRYGKGNLASIGLGQQYLSSFKVKDGYEVLAFKGTALDGDSAVVTGECRSSSLVIGWRPQSIIIRKAGSTGIHSITEPSAAQLRYDGARGVVTIDSAHGQLLTVCDLTGRRYIQQRISDGQESVSLLELPRGIYVVNVGTRTLKLRK